MEQYKAIITLVCSAAVGIATAAEPAADVAEARGLVKQFFSSLKGELQAAMKSGGPVKAIEVCNMKAPAIARDLAQDSGWEVGRTSLKLRNPSNLPDAWENAVLQRFDARKRAGEDPAKIEYSEVVEVDGAKTFRYMKAIPTAEICLICHGSEVDPKVLAQLQRFYPDDKATGYALGDLRGAFTLNKKL